MTNVVTDMPRVSLCFIFIFFFAKKMSRVKFIVWHVTLSVSHAMQCHVSVSLSNALSLFQF